MRDKQKGVNDMALAISTAETIAERALIGVCELPQAIKAFRKECDLHVTKTTQAQEYASEAIAKIGEGLQMLGNVHDEVEAIRCEKMPDIQPQGGGGGGK